MIFQFFDLKQVEELSGLGDKYVKRFVVLRVNKEIKTKLLVVEQLPFMGLTRSCCIEVL